LLNTNFLIGSKTVARQQVAGAQVWDRALAGLMPFLLEKQSN